MPLAAVETLTLLVAAHLLADFALQPAALLRRKRRPGFLLLHVAVVTVAAAVVVGTLAPLLLLVLAVTHGAMDALKVYRLPDGFHAFAGDQLVHLLVLVGLALVWPEAARDGVWPGLLGPEGWRLWLQGWTLAAGVLLALPVAGVALELALRPLAGALAPAESPEHGLPGGGRLIGLCERALAFVLFVAGAQAAIGFVIAAKSILRFGEISDSSHRRLAEYILIGSFFSFAWALTAAWLTAGALALWGAWPASG
ncbi:DUF3307 domain-containing protein [Spiribacter halobius]|uniref:DUF3307 domain-containing protein n=1 Tax=Sediminicurvatus halobius TaxID=2182432 RepID=A0A2U2N8G0_9GAMM|nr:DUF3307 domain-containing protein [Spiribacter halobius]PWG65410.1 hypothetical protein DEM34_01310 [Spiribacter halobius]UEX76429.1 DUF3307 domain-containing protein [Spiribacter halobius]